MGRSRLQKRSRLVARDDGAERDERAVRAQRHAALLFVGVFLVVVAVLGAIRLTGLEEGAAGAVGRWTAAVVYHVLRIAEPDMRLTGNMLSSGRGALSVAAECSGFELAGLLAAAMIAYPAAWRRRLVGVVLLVPFVFALNVLRVASLSLALEHAPSIFELLHSVVWQGVLILAGLGYWLLWWGRRAASA